MTKDPEDIDVEELATRLARAVTDSENVVVRELAKLSLSLIRLRLALGVDGGDDPGRAFRIYDAQIEASLAVLTNMPDARWNAWCDTPKSEMIPGIAEAYRGMGRDLQPTKH